MTRPPTHPPTRPVPRRASPAALLVALSVAAGPALACQDPAREVDPPGPTAELTAAVEAALTARLSEWVETRGLPGVSAAVVLPDGTCLTAVAGHADVDAGTALTPEHRLLSGSVGKTYFSAVALQLVAEGELDPDARVATFFPDDEAYARLPNAAELTVRDLMRHQTGIPRHIFRPGFLEAVLADPDRVWTDAERLSYVEGVEPLSPRGAAFAYADTNYVLLGRVLERVGGAPPYDLVQRRLLTPLGLDETHPTDTRTIPHMAQGHVVASRAFGVPERTLAEGRFVCNVQFEGCGGGYASTARDLARWTHALHAGDVLDDARRALLLDAVDAPELGPGKRYGLGVILTETPLGELRGHDGFMFGYLTCTGHFAEHGLTLALMLNTDDGRAVGAPLDVRLTELARLALEVLEPVPTDR